MSATSEELTDRRDNEPAGGDPDDTGRPGAPVAVPQDVAEETARAIAEAVGDGDEHEHEYEPASAEADHPAEDDDVPRRQSDRHTFLYGKGRRVVPWKHRSALDAAQRRRRKIAKRSAGACVLVAAGTVGWSMTQALIAPGTDTAQVRLAEWGHDHGLASVVTTLEQWQYDLFPPPKGGVADPNQLAALGPTAEPTSSAQAKGKSPGLKPSQSAPPSVVMQPGVIPPVSPALAGEGVFHVAVSTPDGLPVVQVAKVRPDSTYTSKFEDIVWVDQKHTRYVLHPGTEGGINTKVPMSDQITADQRTNLIGLFNGGFKLQESHGGYYDQGITVAPLQNGAASEVIYKDGHMSVGLWGRDFTMGPDIASVRQNLKLMVDNGQVVPYIGDASQWGRADHGSAAVWRSGVGVTAQGDIVWVGGDLLTAPALADLLQRAGAVHGMQLDINLRWPTFQYFPNRDGNPATSKLYDDFLRPASRFFDHSTKDFMAIYLR